MGKFSEMNQKELREARNSLQKVAREVLRTSRVTNLTDSGAYLEGGTFPATYDHDMRSLTIWGRTSRYSGGEMTVDELVEAEKKIAEWFDTYEGGKQ